MTMVAITTGVSSWITAILGWLGDVFTYLVSDAVLPFTLIGVSLMIVGLAFGYVKGLINQH